MSGRSDPIQGELQEQIMRIVWELGEASVEQVRRELPEWRRGAYTTVQTVLNRLTARGLLARRREGQAFRYRPLVSEDAYLAQSVERVFEGASSDARRTALARLVGDLDPEEVEELRRIAKSIERQE